MTTFNFDFYLEKLRTAAGDTERIRVKKELFDYYDALSKEDQQVHKQQLEVFLQKESSRIRGELRKIGGQLSS